jgi:phosphatidate cytidylyltransferase
MGAGKAMGRTPLIKLSPKKTWEGFIGGALGTMAASVALAWAFSNFEWMYCPRRGLAFGKLHCEKPDAFIPATYYMTDLWEVLPEFIIGEIRPVLQDFPQVVRDTTAALSWTCMPAQMHSIALAMFASIIGPFGTTISGSFRRVRVLCCGLNDAVMLWVLVTGVL